MTDAPTLAMPTRGTPVVKHRQDGPPLRGKVVATAVHLDTGDEYDFLVVIAGEPEPEFLTLGECDQTETVVHYGP